MFQLLLCFCRKTRGEAGWAWIRVQVLYQEIQVWNQFLVYTKRQKYATFYPFWFHLCISMNSQVWVMLEQGRPQAARWQTKLVFETEGVWFFSFSSVASPLEPSQRRWRPPYPPRGSWLWRLLWTSRPSSLQKRPFQWRWKAKVRWPRSKSAWQVTRHAKDFQSPQTKKRQ